MSTTAILGMGVMGEALLSGLVRSGVDPDQIVIADRRAERLVEISKKYGVTSDTNAGAVEKAETMVLVVKPQDMGALLEEIAPHMRPSALVVSLAAGITTFLLVVIVPKFRDIFASLGGKLPLPTLILLGFSDAVKREGAQRALQYMGLVANTPMNEIKIDKVFIGSCTNARIEDMRAAAAIAKDKHIAANVKLAMVVPGSGLVKQQAEQEGLDKIFIAAGFEWRDPGCSMCLAMNDDKLSSGERCASTSNRNFEGRQGQGGRTHLVSPEMAAAAAIAGHFVDVSVI